MVAAIDPERKKTLAQFRLMVNGAKASPSLDAAISKIVVDERLHVPTMVEIHLELLAHDLKWVDDPTIAEGKEIEIFAGYSSQEKSLCVAKITSVEVELDDTSPSMIVRGYDLSFALHRDIKSRSFLEQSDSDIARSVAGEAPGLTAMIDSTQVVHPYVLQYAQSNYDFLLERARSVGFEFRVIGKVLHFRKPEPMGSPVTLEWGKSIKRFSPRLSVAEQVSKVEVRGWDDVNKEMLISSAEKGNGAPKIGESKPGSDLAQEVWGRATHVITGSPIGDLNEGTALAQAALDDLTSSFVQATGECMGDPAIRVGSTVSVKGVGKRFSGDYYVTASRHAINKRDGYSVEFSASTREPNLLSSVLLGDSGRATAPHIVIGLVTNNEDPMGLARVKVKIPTLFDSDESFWARLVAPTAGKDRGFLAIPEVNDEVLIAFENGDQDRPYVLGALWSSVDPPPNGTATVINSGSVDQRLWRSRAGHLFIFDDTGGKESIQIIDKTGNNHIIITSSDNKLEVQLDGDIEVTSKTGRISVTAEQDIAIESKSGKVSVKGVTTEFEARNSATMKSGSSMDFESGTSLGAKAGSSLAMSGATSAKMSAPKVDVQGDAMTNIKGGVVNIN